MARSATRPIVGGIVWYFTAAPPSALPQAALVVAVTTPAGSGFGVGVGPVLTLAVWDAAGAMTAVAGVPFHYGTRPATSIPWCTMPRVYMPATPTSWPSGAAVGG
jgi:hypothetical protein